MNRKSFQTAPKPKQPSPEDIAAFERAGTGHEALPENVCFPKDTNVGLREPTKRLSLDLPSTMHRRFKTVCSATGRKMVAEVMAFIERRTAELEAEAGMERPSTKV